MNDNFTEQHLKSLADKNELIEEARKLFQECVDQENYLNTPWFKDVIDWLNKVKN